MWTTERLTAHVHSVLEPRVQPDEPLLLAFSGGADSVALLLALLTLPDGRRIVAAHVDHGLDDQSSLRAQQAQQAFQAAVSQRGLADRSECAATESSARVTRVQSAPDQTKEPQFVLLRAAEHASQTWDDNAKCTPNPSKPSPRRPPNHGVEANARRTRYRLLEELANSTGIDHVLTAHHDDDQLETLILRLRQGTGLDGLKGIQQQRGQVLRPLLSTRDSIGPPAVALRAILKKAQLPWVEDPSNEDLRLQRNLVRHRILPILSRPRVANASGPAPSSQTSLTYGAQQLALQAARSEARLDGFLEPLLAMEREGATHGSQTASNQDSTGSELCVVSLDFLHWLRLPEPVQTASLHTLHRLAGMHFGPTRAAKAELQRQVVENGWHSNSQPRNPSLQPSTHRDRYASVGRPIGCACGAGWFWRTQRVPTTNARSVRLQLLPSTLKG